MMETFVGTISLIVAGVAWVIIHFAPDPISNRDKRYVHPRRKVVKK